MNSKKAIVMLALSASLLSRAFGHDETNEIGWEEQPGVLVDLDLVFRDESGSPLSLRDIVKVPTILSFQYFGCDDSCGLLLTNLALALGELDDPPGTGYRVLTVSIDERDTPEAAREKKRLALSIMGVPAPEGSWLFLTGAEASYHELAEEVGFHYERRGDDVVHPLGVVILSPQGKVVRYIKSEYFLPADLTFSLMEASTGTILPTVSRVARFCFTVDPSGRRLTFNALKVTGALTLTMAASLVLFIAVRGRKRRAGGATE